MEYLQRLSQVRGQSGPSRGRVGSQGRAAAAAVDVAVTTQTWCVLSELIDADAMSTGLARARGTPRRHSYSSPTDELCGHMPGTCAHTGGSKLKP